jgi:hypothetical protein
MIAQLNAGNKVKFQYVDRSRNVDTYPPTTQYNVENYEGVVIEVRDTEVSKLEYRTVLRKPEVERSRFLMVVQLPDNKIKSFYDGRIINIQEVKEVPKSFLKRTLDKFRGK